MCIAWITVLEREVANGLAPDKRVERSANFAPTWRNIFPAWQQDSQNIFPAWRQDSQNKQNSTYRSAHLSKVTTDMMLLEKIVKSFVLLISCISRNCVHIAARLTCWINISVQVAQAFDSLVYLARIIILKGQCQIQEMVSNSSTSNWVGLSLQGHCT